jgi:hypothetical protein
MTRNDTQAQVLRIVVARGTWYSQKQRIYTNGTWHRAS